MSNPTASNLHSGGVQFILINEGEIRQGRDFKLALQDGELIPYPPKPQRESVVAKEGISG